MGSTGSGRRKMWMLVGLLAVGALLQACTDNKGPAGPRFPAGQTGDPAFGGTVDVLLHPGPGEDQFIVSVFVLSANSKPAENRRVQLHTSAGSLNPVFGVTDHNGEFRSVLTCDGPATVTAFSEGVTGSVGACGGVVITTGAGGTGTGTGTTTP